MIQEIENKFISSLLRDAVNIPRAIAQVPEEALSTPQGRWLYKSICQHFMRFGTGITPTVLRTMLQETFDGDIYEEYHIYSKNVAATDPKGEDFEFYLDRVLNGKSYRDILSTLQNVASSITPVNATVKIEQLEDQIAKIRNGAAGAVINQHDLSSTVLEGIKRFDKKDDDDNGIPTPIKDLNETIGGLKKSQLIVISAPSGGGKSQILLQFGDHAHKLGKNVVFATLEMSYRDLEDRRYSLVTGMDAKKISNKTLNEEERKTFYYRLLKRHIASSEISKLNTLFKMDNTSLGLQPTEEEIKIYGEISKEKALDRFLVRAKDLKMSENKFFIVDAPDGMTISKLRSTMRHLSNRFPIDLLVVDYLTLLHSGGRNLENWLEAATVARSLKQISREYKIPVLTAAQLHVGKTDGKAKDNPDRLTQNDMRYSKAINENSDFVIAFRRSEKDELMGIIRLELIKHRGSEGKIITVRERFKTMAIENLVDGSK